MMSLKELDKNFKVLSSDRGMKTIISIKEPEKQVEESVEHAKRSKTTMNVSNETSSARQHVHTLNMFHQNIVLRGEDFQEAASEVALPSLKSDEKLQHVLKINISEESSKSANKKSLPRKSIISTMSVNQDQSLCSGSVKPFDGNLSDDQKLVLSVSDGTSKCTIKNKSDMKLMNANVKGILLSGKCSPYDDHLDSGTCSDAEAVSIAPSSDSPQPPAIPPKGVKSNRPKQHALSDSFCSDASSSSSTDSVQMTHSGSHLESPDLIRSINDQHKTTLLPTSLLVDIRNHPVTFSVNQNQDQSQYEDKLSGDDEQEKGRYGGFECNDSSDSINEKLMTNFHEEFLKFHMSEHLSYDLDNSKVMIHDESDESFAGIKDLRSGTSTIRSSKGTIRGVKNRVRNGIATFLQMQQTTVKNYKEKDGGKIVLYTTSMGIIRSTYTKCQTVKKILNTLMVKFEERDVFMSHVHQQEIRDRMQMDVIDVPQLFVDGQYIGNADQVERFNEMGELRKMLKTFKCKDSLRTCRICGGYNMLPCSSCGGSKKSIHRNHFTSEFIALKCMNCDEVGLVRCYNCS